MGVDPTSHPYVEVIQPHVADRDPHFAICGFRVWNLDDLENFRATMGIDAVRLHGTRL